MSVIESSCRRRPVNAGKPWSGADNSDLLDYEEQRFPVEDAAELLCREPHEVEARLEQLRPKAWRAAHGLSPFGIS